MSRKPLVSSLSVMFKKATNLSSDVDDVKKVHRENLKFLVDDYMDKVKTGKADGIKSARELVDVIKADMLLLGEATERNETNTVDQMKIDQISQVIDENDPQIKAVLDSLFDAMNGVNDGLDRNKGKASQVASEDVDEDVSEGTLQGQDDEVVGVTFNLEGDAHE